MSDETKVSDHSLDLLRMETNRLEGAKNSIPTPPDVDASEDKEMLFKESNWKGNLMYQCRLCPFNTFYPDRKSDV